MKKFPLLYRYLLSYLLILVIPVMSFAYLINFRYLGILKDEMTRYNQSTLQRLMAVSDAGYGQLENLRRQLLLSRELRPFSLYGNINHSRACIEELSRYKNADSRIFELALFFRGDDYLYTSQGSYHTGLFIGSEYHYHQWEEVAFRQALEQSTLPSVRPVETVTVASGTEARVVTFLYPLSYLSAREPDATLLILVEEEVFTGAAWSGSDATRLLVLDKTGLPLMAAGEPFPGDTGPELPAQWDRAGELTLIREEHGVEYLICGIRSPDTGWTYLTYTPLDRVLSRARSLQAEALGYLLAVLAVGSVVVYWSIRANYSPIRRLKRYAEGIFQGRQGEQLGELETVHSAMEYLKDRHTSLIEITQESSRSYILHNLLRGQYSRESLAEEGADYGIVLEEEKDLFLVATLRIHREVPPRQIVEAVEAAAGGSLPPPLIADSLSPHSAVIILSFGRQQADGVDNALNSLHQELRRSLDCDVTLGIGGVCQGLEGIPGSYMESSYAADYRFVKGNDSVIRYQEAVSYSDSLDSYPYRDLERLKYLLRMGDAQPVEELLTALLTYAKQGDIPMFEARRLCYDMAGIIVKAIRDLDIDLKSHHSYPALLSEFETVDDLVDVMRNICTNICRAMKESRLNNTSLANRLRAYVEANCHDCSFSIQAMAAHFDMGVTHLSQYFRRKTGQTIIDYATNLRMEMAKELLPTQKHNLSEVTEMVGYANTSSFIRRFKQYTGITPGQYMREFGGQEEAPQSDGNVPSGKERP